MLQLIMYPKCRILKPTRRLLLPSEVGKALPILGDALRVRRMVVNIY